MFMLLHVIYTLALMGGSHCLDFKPRVATRYGVLEGHLIASEDVKYYSYTSVPFAQPPVGPLRFQSPRPPVAWDGVKNATQPSPACPQTLGEFTADDINEDCLYLNVYVPAHENGYTPKSAFPVLFWVHGGEYKFGSSRNFGAKYLIAKEVIVVTTNYRLGALGFLCAKTADAPGNAGLADMVAALRWVQENIAAFGGDPRKVTLAGQSAGSVSVQYLLLTAMTEGLFHNAILDSGSAVGYRFLSNTTRSNTIALASELGYKGGDTMEDIVAFLRQVSYPDIVLAQESMGRNFKPGCTVYTPFIPCVEDLTTSKDPIVTDYPLTLVKRGFSQNVPVMVGFNAQEGIKMLPALFKNASLIIDIDNDFERCVPSDIAQSSTAEEVTSLAADIKSFYFGSSRFTDQTYPQFVDLITDTMYLHSIDHTLRIHAAKGTNPKTFYYRFSVDGPLNMAKIRNNITFYPGTAHADDLGYVWTTPATTNVVVEDGSRSWLARERIVAMWTNFVKYSDPTPEENDVINYKWIPVDYPQVYYLDFGENPSMKTDPYRNRTMFWEMKYVV